MRLSRTLLLLAVAAIGLSPPARADEKSNGKSESSQAEIDPLDWPNWRGPEQNGISRETGLIDHWSKEGDNVIWKSDALGSRSTPIVMRGKLYTICSHEPGTPREQEKVVCADASTGDILWENRFNVFLSDVPKERLGWSCCAGDPTTGRIYAMGVCDYFQCLDGDTGETIWSHSLSEEYGFLSTYGGRTNVPVVFEDLVIINAVVIGWGDMAQPAHRFVAFDKRTGVPVWFNGTRLRPTDTTYSTPVLTVLGGQAALVFGSGDGGVWAFQPRTGRPLWSCYISQRGLNTTPVVEGDTVYMSHSEENINDNTQGGLCAIDGTANLDPAAKSVDITKSGKIWSKKQIMIGKSSPVVVDGRLYALDDSGPLYVFDTKTGKQIAKQRLIGTIARASLLYADGKIYACTTSGWHVLEPTEKGVKIIDKIRFGQGQEVHGSPIVSHGRIYLPTTETLYCLGDVNAKTGVDKRPDPPSDESAGDDRPAHVQVVPVESLISPGDKLQYRVRLYDARGRFIKEAEAEDVAFDVDGGGKIDEQGQFAADKGRQHVGCTVTAKVGDLMGKARIRIVPPLPWKFDFADQKVPITWVGARYRHIPLDFDLLQSLKEQEERAGQLYIYFTTTFLNSGQDKASFNDRTPRRTWTNFLRYLGLDQSDTVKTLAGAKKELEAALKVVREAGIIAEFKWTGEDDDVGLDVARGKRESEGNGVMVKITTIPLGTRSQGWMGQPEHHDYTIQADVRGSIRNGKQPDIGLIAQRYTLSLMGIEQQLQIRSWTSELHRFSKTVPFKWNYDTWYTMKFRASVEEGKAVLRGKVWPRDEDEPEDWSIEAIDEVANAIGSPGLFGNAQDAEIFIDNLSVTEN